MTNTAVEVITSVQRRRRWATSEKERLIAASLEPGVSVSVIAREAGIHPSQLYGWRRQLGTERQIGFTRVRIAPEAPQTGLRGPGMIEIEFANGARMRITGAIDAATLAAAVAALSAGRRQ